MAYRILLGSVIMFFFSCKEQVKTPLVTSNYSCAPVVSDREWYKTSNKAPLFEGMGNLSYPIETEKSVVQDYFDQGMVLSYGFNHAEAARSFYYATKLDSTCAMAYWGYAYVLGPNYNAGMEDDNYERAYEAIQKALDLSKNSTNEKEKGIIYAMSKRYVKEPAVDRRHLDVAYSGAMRLLYEQYPNDSEIGTLYAESLMNLHKWDLYEKDGQIKPWTPEILEALQNVLSIHPNHPGANHFFIHAVEQSKNPGKGLPSAKKFDDGIVPNAGHLVHMPSHIYIRTGDYHKGTLANINAIEVDSSYVAACNAQGVYPLSYYPHNQHFMAATATPEGNGHWAIYAANAVSKNANLQLMKEPGWGTLQHYYTIPYYVFVKFGKWDSILGLANEVPELEYPSAILHYAKGMAYLGKNQISKANLELRELRKIAENEKLKEITIWDINTVYDLVQIAHKVLNSQLLLSEGKEDESIQVLREAIAIEDGLNYNEPPDWFFSVRHYLGHAQLSAGRFDDAILTYQEDLERLPKNGWALKGLELAYKGKNETEKESETGRAFSKSWEYADISINSSIVQ
ncbi:hypothetical protein NYZ99_19965 [Maribacter litopenaei]|uniref:Tetratricopeptide repeat protein n=1 Tax=Maribacter litopenaei TaxID=2976127 RepID=A0ABY5Y7Y6_9FLAO|nr:hypothetical protein [Maribacter litopenaei]UWX54966.1 hypothetical protein NYZ99_19965 [Maribacter litopenaei]